MSVPLDKKKFDVMCGEKGETIDIYTTYFRKYYPALLYYVSRFLDQTQAEDVVQDAFLDLWQRRDRIDMSEHLGAFLYRSVYTRALNTIKHETIVKNHSQDVIDIYNKKATYLSPDNNEILKHIESNELGKEVYAVIESLPEKCREVFKLSYINDLKNKEIAEALGISVKTVEAHMYKALKLLRSKLGHLTTLMIFILYITKNIIS